MHSKKFLVYNICRKFPEDINGLIYTMVKNDAAERIQWMYYNRVKLNLDILSYFLRLGGEVVEPLELKRIIVFFSNKIKYNFINEPAIWIDALNDIYYPHHVHLSLPIREQVPAYSSQSWADYIHAERSANSIRNSLIERIKLSNEVYCRSQIEWWQYF